MIKLVKSTFFNEKATKKKLCDFIMKAEQLSMGKLCADFEKAFSKWQGRKYSVMFNSGSSANHALIQALVNLGRLKRGDRVGFSAVTWATNTMPLIALGLSPIPVDVELDTLNISPRKLLEAHKKYKFKCLFITNTYSFSDDIASIKTFCKKNKILLIEDNCESIGSEYKSTKLGNFGLASTFSFFVGHHMSTIEGGMVSTNDKELDTALRMLRAHGWDRNLDKAEQTRLRKKHKIDDFYGKFAFYDIGYNLRPMEIQGFLGLDQLPYLDAILDKRERNYKKLQKIYSNPDFLKIPGRGMTRIPSFSFILICKNKALRDKYLKLAKDADIETRPVAGGNMANQVFFKKYVKGKFHLPNAEHIHRAGFFFANNPDLTQAEINLILKTFS